MMSATKILPGAEFQMSLLQLIREAVTGIPISSAHRALRRTARAADRTDHVLQDWTIDELPTRFLTPVDSVKHPMRV